MTGSDALLATTDYRPGRSRRHGSSETVRWLRRSLWPCVLVAGVATVAMTVLDSSLEAVDASLILGVLVGLAFAGSGLYAWGRRPENRLGVLMTVVGFTYLVWHILIQAHSSSVYTGGIWLSDSWTVVFVLFLLSFPEGRLNTRFDLVILAMFATVALPLELLWLLFFRTGGSPENALAAWPNSSVADDVDSAQRALLVTASVVLAATLWRRRMVASPPLRRALIPALVGSAAILLSLVLLGLDKFDVEFETARWVVLGAYLTIPLVVLAGILRARLARSTVGELFVELRADPSLPDLRDALARALRDPSLTLAYWLPQFRSWADVNGESVELPGDGSGHATTLIDRHGEHLAALLHDPALLDEPELLNAVAAAAGIALENGRLHVELRARLEELRGSRSRVFDAGQRERKRLERNLHDGAQQRLIALSLELGLLEEQVDMHSDMGARLSQARSEIANSLEELREVAHGIHPAVVSGHGLEIALEQLAARAPVPIRLLVDVGGRLPELLEVAVYYLVAESLANVGKYAQASFVSVEVNRRGNRIVVEVADDGIGGADTERGSGLRGLADRIEALEGRLRIWSPNGGGTRLRAEIPCES